MPQGENNKGVISRVDYESAARKAGKNYMLVIGIDDYAHCPTLYNAVKDAQDIVEVLQDRFRFEAENITTLYNEKATKRNIYNAFRAFRRKVTSQDNFLVYFSGHGEFDKDFGLGYWISVNAELGAVDAYIPNSEIRNIFSAIESHHTFLMVDSCFSGVLFAKGTGKNIPLRKERDPSRWGLTAGRNEIVTDGQPGKNSPFAESILYQLKHTDTSLGVAELCDKVLEVVSANANQTPRGEPLKVDGHQGGQFVFHLKMDEAADWKNALATNTTAAFQSFVAQYPDSINVIIAKGKIKAIAAETLWQKIEIGKDTNLREVKSKLRLVNQYVDKYEDQIHYDEALNIGELLEYKKQYFQAQSSEFALRRFLRKPTPNVDGASVIRETAKVKLANWDNSPAEVEEPATIIPPVKKKIVETSTIKPTPSPKPVISKPPEPSFFKKYGKYLLLLLIPILGFGIYQAIGDGGSDITKNEPVVEPPETTTDPVKTIPPLELDYSWGKDLLIANIKGGEPPYFLQLVKGNKQKYSTQLNIAKRQEIPILKEYRADAGTHQLIVKDSKGKEVSKIVNIDPPRISQAQEEYIQERPVNTSAKSGTFKDSRNGQTYKWVRLKDGKKWMAQNLNYKTNDSWWYKNDKSNGTKYGRLYTWKAAKKACPSGWRLPSDDEWWKMASYYGKAYNSRNGQEINKKGNAGEMVYKALIQEGHSGFFALLGGARYSTNDNFKGLDSNGDYWSGDEKSSLNAYSYNFRDSFNSLRRNEHDKNWAFSCRCIQD